MAAWYEMLLDSGNGRVVLAEHDLADNGRFCQTLGPFFFRHGIVHDAGPGACFALRLPVHNTR